MVKKGVLMILALCIVIGMLNACVSTQQPQNTGTEPVSTQSTEKKQSLKVLTLGHSLAVDSGHMLALVAAAEGFPELTVGTLYYSGCPLYLHVEHLKTDARVYNLYLSSTADVSTPPSIIEGVTMREAIRHQEWDIILMQGGGFEIGESEKYTDGNIQAIQDYVNQNKLNPDAVFGWHMAWALPVDNDLRNTYPYQPNTYINSYVKYNDDRNTLYQAITKCVSDHIVTDDTFTCIIPSATVMENALSSYLTEKDLHRDYSHATDFARLMVSYLWYCVLTGVDQLEEINLDVVPKNYFVSTKSFEDWVLTEEEKALILESVNNALANPFQMTQSKRIERPAT